MADRNMPKNRSLILLAGIAAIHCPGNPEDEFDLLCTPTMAQVGERVNITLDYTVESTANSFEWSVTPASGAVETPSQSALTSSGQLSNGVTSSQSGTVEVSVSRGGEVLRSCQVQFAGAPTFDVTVTVTGNGSVRLVDGDCPSDCEAMVEQGQTIDLVATPDAGWVFDRWLGDCNGTDATFSLEVDDDKGCEAQFLEDDGPGPGEVLIPASMFTRGCNPSTDSCAASATPALMLNMSSFIIDLNEITVGEYRACVDDGTCSAPLELENCNYTMEDREDHPVNCVTHEQAREYCAFVNSRLPTEAEWEMAARGTMDARRYPWGNEDADCTRGNFFVATDLVRCVNDTAPVGTSTAGASPFGLLDTAGNVSEWVEDWFVVDYYSTAPDTDPPPPPQGVANQRVRRGGSFRSSTLESVFVYARSSSFPTTANDETGFRCAR
ncbi:MAG: SUMF1/EgtB/PvdO family nonheme iron enzyme [Myxococcota bacterium]